MKTPHAWFSLSSVLVLSLLAAPAARAQRALVQQFAASTVLLTTGDTLHGPLTLHADRDLLLLTMPDQTVRTVAAVAVRFFAVQGEQTTRSQQYYDYYDFYDARRGYYGGSPRWLNPPPPRPERPDTALVRVFRSLRWNRGNDYSDFRMPAFFEQLSRGPVLLLRRESLVERPINAPSSYYAGGYGYGLPRGTMGYYTELRPAFFLGTPEGEVVELRNPKKDLLAYFQPEARQLEQYAKEHKLNFSDARELAYLINYANSLRYPAP
ncbi:hypothetical protein [Hymenobacter sp. B81]|uniref:hypothetical protein n=1 Tax=Hymenobacter sp. B81 TaxID=3344878 RepID=UPI0037DD080B